MSKILLRKNFQKNLQNLLFSSMILTTSLFSLSACDKEHNKQPDKQPEKQVEQADNSGASVEVKIYKLEPGKPSNDPNNFIGTVSFKENQYGLLITPNLRDITPGEHGFHLHNNATCDAAEKDGAPVLGLAAGDHYDPDTANKHTGPYTAEGHLGDLPVLYVDQKGNANTITLAPRLKFSDLKGRTVMIHAGPDNYSDSPKAGGGGDRKYCGVITIDS